LESRPKGEFRPSEPTHRGLRIERSYAKLGADNRVVPTTAWRSGDRVLVTLRITADQTTEWVAIEDPLPATLEVVSRRYTTPTSNTVSTQEWYSDFEEVRGDSVRSFRNRLHKGDYELHYIARIKTTGKVIAPAARIEAMYEPQRFGTSSSSIWITEE
jgi:hypothetical protein